ncbi:MAG: amidohydrolase family protein [Terracidiphilus sp.]|jgi:N-acyl-D-aspartate/D-glutamate deacylase
MRTISQVLIATLVGIGATTAVHAQEGAAPLYDIVIRHGRVLDGAGNPWIAADVAISNGRFVKIGKVEGTGRREIDAAGLYVSPGWIDVMDQSAEVLLKNGLADNKLREGVTTAIAGEGGTPVDADHIDEYFNKLKQQGISMNFGCYYSEAQARVAVIGEVDRPPTPEELVKMKALMATAMQQGAMGMTTALIYPPSSYAKTDELIAMARVAGAYGGLYASHMRGEGKEVVQAVDELIQISEQGHLPAEIFHLKVAYQPDWSKSMALIGEHVAAARARGDEIAGDLYMYTAGGTGLEATIPSWAFDGGDAALKKRLADPAIRERLKHDQQTGSPGWWNIIEAAGGWDGIVLVDAANPENRKYEGKSMTVIAKEMGKSPADAAFDLVEQGQSRVLAVYHMMSEADVETALKFNWTAIGSDSGASEVAGQPADLNHPRAYGNFPRVIARYVRETHTLTLEDAIRKMTSWPATRLRFSDRGVIREGARADVTIFDYDKIQDTSTYEHPVSYPEGIPYVLVNGVVVIDHAAHTGAKPGDIIYGQGHGLNLPQAVQ